MKKRRWNKNILNLGIIFFGMILLTFVRMPDSVHAEPITESCGANVTATLDDYGTLTISGTGDMAPGNVMYAHRKSINKVVIEDGVTSIGKEAFYWGYENLSEVKIGKTVKTIGKFAFYHCPLYKVDIPSGVTQIEDGAFYLCSTLTSCTLHEGLTDIGARAFAYCSNLKDVKLPDSLLIIQQEAFYRSGINNNITIPKNVKKIGKDAFYGIHYVTIESRDVALDTGFANYSATLCVHRGSSAEAYANSHGYKFEYIKVNIVVTWDANGGYFSTSNGKSAVLKKNCESEKEYGLIQNPKRAGYLFKGWYTSKSGGSVIKAEDTITKETNFTVYAQWTKVSVKKASKPSVARKSSSKIKVKIKKVKNADGYRIRYAVTKGKLAKGKAKNYSKEGTKTLSGLKAGKTYYIQVCAYKKDSAGKKVYGQWSPIAKLKLKK